MKKQASKTARYIGLILGIKVSGSSKEEVLNELIKAASEENFEAPRLVVTPNPEIIMAAQESQELKRVLNSAYLSVPDGVGLKLFGGVKEVIPGRVLAGELIGEAAKCGMRAFLLGGRPGVAETAAQSLKSKFQSSNQETASAKAGQSSKFKIKTQMGPWVDENGRSVDSKQQAVEKNAIDEINKFRPHFLFVGFGPPKQEFWLDRNLPRLKVAVAMTVGGAFDYWASIVPFPPKILSQAGLEWLWRLITQPWRAGRIFTAVIRFPLAVLWYKLTH